MRKIRTSGRWGRKALGAAALGLLMMNGLAAAAQEDTAQEETVQEETAQEETASYSEQLPAFVNQVSVWKPRTNASYAYVDLDQNGMLEVLTSYTSKKGEVTNGLWELRDGRLTECELPWGDEDAQTELKEQSVPVYYDSENEIYYYLFGTESEEEEASVTAVWLKDGVLNAEILEEEASVRFEGMEEMTASIGWISTAEHTLKDAPLEQLTELGGDSLSAFALKPAQETEKEEEK